MRIRNFGFLANRNRAALLPLCLQLLGGSQKNTATPASPSTDQTHSLWNCPVCGSAMRVASLLGRSHDSARNRSRRSVRQLPYHPELSQESGDIS